MEFLVVIGIGGYAVYFIAKIVDSNRTHRLNVNEVAQSTKKWLVEVEPLHRNFRGYPEDWSQRKLYVQKRDNFKCQQCGFTMLGDRHKLRRAKELKTHSMWTELHIHHIVPLSKGGTNELSNLVALCERCHENKHPHMLKLKLAQYVKKANRARSPSMIRHWERLIAETERRIHS